MESGHGEERKADSVEKEKRRVGKSNGWHQVRKVGGDGLGRIEKSNGNEDVFSPERVDSRSLVSQARS